MTPNTSAAILNRLIEPESDDLSPDAARSLLRLDFRAKDHARMSELSASARAGTLTLDEREELEEYLRVADMLAVLQSKARRSLQRVGAS
jgi:hypothetical protein